MANELYNDGKYIFINTPYAEAYIPDDIFDGATDDMRPSSLAFSTGDSLLTIGIFFMRFFDDESIPREKVKVRTLDYPNMIESKPSGIETKETLTFYGDTDKYRVFRYQYGDILMEATSAKTATNVEKYTKLVMAGRVPESLSYDENYFSWKENFEINGVGYAIPPVLLQAVISKMCRVKENLTEEFRFAAAKGVEGHQYKMLNMNTVSAYASAMSSMSFERFSEKLTTSINMTKTGAPQDSSPIESVLMM